MDYITFRYAMSGSTTISWDLPYPKKFEMQKVPNIVSEITTMTGQTYADINGWKYANTTIEWGALYPEDLQKLVGSMGVVKYGPAFTLTFIDANKQTQTVNAVLRGFHNAKTLARQRNGDYVWEGVSIDLSFPDCYQY